MREDTQKYMEWKRRYTDTHTELSVMNSLTGSLIATSPGDRNIVANKQIPGKHIIEKKCAEKRNEDLDNFIHDTIELRSEEILEVPYKTLLDLSIKARPRKIEGNMEHTYTFSDMVKNASKFEKDLKRAEETRNNTVDVEFTEE